MVALLESHFRPYADGDRVRTFSLGFTAIDRLTAESRATYHARRDAYQAAYERVLREGVTRGEFGEMDVKLTTFALLGMLNHVSVWFDRSGRASAHEVATAFARLILDGVRVRVPGTGIAETSR
jgi:hypothetical protein